MQTLTPGVTVFTSALYQTNSIVIRSDADVFVIDPNWLPAEVGRIKEFVERHKGGRNVHLIFSHSDYDHIIGYRAFEGVHAIASSAFASNPNKDRDVGQARKFDQSHYITRDYPLEYPQIDIAIDHDGQVLEFGETQLTFYQAPGHTDEGMFIICEPQGIFIAGDYLSDIEFPLISGSVMEYRETMGKVEYILARHSIRHLIPGHGNTADSHEEIILRRDQAVEYLEDIDAFISQGSEFPNEKYRQRYTFWAGINEWHQENISHVLNAQQTPGLDC